MPEKATPTVLPLFGFADCPAKGNQLAVATEVKPIVPETPAVAVSTRLLGSPVTFVQPPVSCSCVVSRLNFAESLTPAEVTVPLNGTTRGVAPVDFMLS